MALFTGKGDNGTTYKFDSKDRFSKASNIASALGTVDELNTFLGLIKIHSQKKENKCSIDANFSSEKIYAILHEIQENLFIVQAQLAGAEKIIEQTKIEMISQKLNEIEKVLPPITTFLIAGGSELSAELDFARTIARRAERVVVGVSDEGKIKIESTTLAYLNRLSSMLYALARLVNHAFDITENKPSYE
jgi:cob(I)alamin adenosyltransferase